MNQRYSEYGFLDAARGLSAFVVLLAHAVQIFWLRFFGADSPLNAVSSTLSYYAVIVFFLLSGFLITHSVETNIQRNGRFDVVKYACARTARIYPPFLIAFVMTLLVFGILDFFALPGRGSVLSLPGDLYAVREIVAFPPKEMISSLFMLGGGLEVNGPLWSLYIEVKLYVLFACAYCVCLGVARILALVVSIGVLLIAFRFQPEFAHYAVLWLLGCIVYLVFGSCVPARRLKLWSSVAVSLAFAAAWQWTGGAARADMSAWDAILELLIAATLIILLVRFRLQVPVGRKLAPYSYTLYVVHFPILLLCQSLLIASETGSIAAAAAASVASVILALVLSWMLGSVERRKQSIQSALERSASGVTSRWRAAHMSS